MERYTIRDIKRMNKNSGLHWFSPDTMRFFRSRVGDKVYQGNGGVYFISSEQFVGSDGRSGERMYTVRKFDPVTASIDTVGDFNKLTYQQARYAASKLAKDE